ncbi:PPE domain-containing protein [Streptomyces sodiiphilus]|uniref:PPE domain-containing protein n=1 Tax=Streptomyces sodiiphilus TaxID=226217 RepID=A0ABN2NSB1_9ACTN
MSLSYEDLYHLRLGNLSEAVQAWGDTAQRLKEQAEEARTGMRAKAVAARWRGENAEVTRPFVITTAGRFAAAHAQAEGMHAILRDLHHALSLQQRKLLAAESEAAAQGLSIRRDGTVTIGSRAPLDPGEVAGREQAAEEISARVTGILRQVEITDAEHARALYHLAGSDGNDHFTGHTFESVGDSYELFGSEADRAASDFLGLVQSDRIRTVEGMEEAHSLLLPWSDDPDFAAAVALALGPEGTLLLWAELNDRQEVGKVTEDRVRAVANLHESLGNTIATATHVQSPEMKAWRDEVVAHGAGPVPMRSGIRVHGFQIMSSLMEHGDWDADFLNTYGNSLIAMEMESKVCWPGRGPGDFVSVLGDDFRHDPMTGFMSALSRDPSASLEFFGPHGHLERETITMQYLLRDRDMGSLLDEEVAQSGLVASRVAIGDALTAAATGLDPNGPESQEHTHTEANKQIVDRALRLLDEAGDDFAPEFRQPMARVLVNHGAAFIDTAGNTMVERPFSVRNLSGVVVQLSRDPVAYGILNGGINHQLFDSMADEATVVGQDLNPKNILDRAGKVVGFLGQGRHDALSVESDEEVSRAEWQARYAYHGIGGIVTFLPGAGDLVQREVDIRSQGWLEDEKKRLGVENEAENWDVREAREQQLEALADEWYRMYSDWADGETGYQTRFGRSQVIGAAANDGRDDTR